MFKLFFTGISKKALKNLDKKIKKRVDKALLDLETYPLPVNEYDIKRVSGRISTWRIRISKYRIVYEIDWKNSEVNVLKIEKKDDETYR